MRIINLLNENHVEHVDMDTLFIRLLGYSGWCNYRTRYATRRVESWNMKQNPPEKLKFIEDMAIVMMQLIQSQEDQRVIPIQLFLCMYEGEESCPSHHHDCRQATLSIGADRYMFVDNKKILLHHGDMVTLNGEQHGVPKCSERARMEPRASLNLFYTIPSEAATASVTPRLSKRRLPTPNCRKERKT
eukprot:TRINITY_DN17230_c0_g1_i1.p1 TRINITY_DN17230_c0_g1~~TRINITY_DN17230_c0_g1_i1.p1  ORF type:complete len:202 (+),score=23.15 TRINITY_DN17230_c0_g1_i1:45-608(+)